MLPSGIWRTRNAGTDRPVPGSRRAAAARGSGIKGLSLVSGYPG
jgi:hypothetical protein